MRHSFKICKNKQTLLIFLLFCQISSSAFLFWLCTANILGRPWGSRMSRPTEIEIENFSTTVTCFLKLLRVSQMSRCPCSNCPDQDSQSRPCQNKLRLQGLISSQKGLTYLESRSINKFRTKQSSLFLNLLPFCLCWILNSIHS